MQQHDIPPEIIKAVPGVLGAFVSLIWIRGSLPQRLTSFVGGAAASYYGAEHMVTLMGVSERMVGFSGFLVGLFGMAVAARVFDAIQAIDIGGLLSRLAAKWFGV